MVVFHDRICSAWGQSIIEHMRRDPSARPHLPGIENRYEALDVKRLFAKCIDAQNCSVADDLVEAEGSHEDVGALK